MSQATGAKGFWCWTQNAFGNYRSHPTKEDITLPTLKRTVTTLAAAAAVSAGGLLAAPAMASAAPSESSITSTTVNPQGTVTTWISDPQLYECRRLISVKQEKLVQAGHRVKKINNCNRRTPMDWPMGYITYVR